MAGKEHGGIEQADATLFRDAIWFFVPSPGQDLEKGLIAEYRNLLEGIGARIHVIDAGSHDRICGWTSHLPQMVSTALAGILLDEFGENPEVSNITSRGLREMTRTASSPYSMWRDIALTNAANIEAALLKLE
jgi:prephenate dehydrogenase